MKVGYSIFATLLILLLTFAGAGATLEETCNQVTSPSSATNLTYDFCLTSLQPISGSREVDVKGLAGITINLSIYNFTYTRNKLGDLKSKETKQPAIDALQKCLDKFNEGDAYLKMAQTSLRTLRYQDAFSSITSAAGSSVVCDNAFYERGIQSPVSLDTQNGYLLCTLAAYLIQYVA
ncbi:Plant invertase/pectin methylesterase inhibitor protein [Dioscorea alata]|uniref:Plant invertase/pectin methylesterase inhibitor protein n=1 Tax=Dioscorea alata TaxID=55571 RepID=A0ACB7U4Q5_DIOAL|nr:Plant invertase/pectin methylesterase inhibitor protein [Dioscorea alata]